MQDNYPNLPGILAEFKDGGLVLRNDPNPPSTESILLLGTSLDGPYMKPVAIDANTVELLLGRAVNANGVPNGSTLVKGFEQVYAAGCRDIRVMRITGDKGLATVKAAATTFNSDKSFDEVLGTAPGNDIVTFQLNQPVIDVASVIVTAQGVDLAPADYSVTNGTAGTAASVTGSVFAAASAGDVGNLVLALDGGADITVAVEDGDSLATIVGKVNTAAGAGVDVASAAAGALKLTSRTTGATSSVNIKVASTPATLTALGLIVGIESGDAAIPAQVVLVANVANANVDVFITYSYVDGGSTVTRIENAYTPAVGPAVPYKATGSDKVFTLSHVPKTGSVRLYINGLEASAASFTVNALIPSLTLKPGYAALEDNLEASFLYVETVTEEPTVKIEAVYAGALYNEASVEVKNITNIGGTVIGKLLVIVKPESKKAQITEPPMQFSSLDFPTFGLLAQAVNTFPGNNIVRLSTNNRFVAIETKNLQVQPSVKLAGGADGVQVTKQQLFEALGGVRDADGFVTSPGAYQLLENYTVDTLIPLGVYADDELPGKYDSFGYQLALAVAVMSHRNSTTHGIIVTSSPDEVGLAAIDAHVKALLTLNMSFNMRDRLGNEIKDSEGKKIDLGRFISVHAGPDVNLGSGRFGVYAENAPGVYGGMISNMAVQSAPTNKQVPGVLSLRFNYSNSQLDALTGARFVTYRTKQNGTIVSVTDAMTAAQPTSDYRRLVTYRVVKEAVNEVREVCDPYIGEPNEVQQRNAMSAAISKRLDRMKEAGALVDYTFQVIATPEMQLLGQAQIELTIVPPMELRQITTVVSLRAAL